MLSRRPTSRHNRGRIASMPAGLLTNAIANIGDSITQGAGSTGDNGWRQALYDRCVAQGYGKIFVGSRNHGTFGAANDRRHDGLPATQIATRVTLLQNSYGIGKLWPGGKLMVFMIGTNNMRQPGGQYSLSGSMADWRAMLAAAHQAWPFARKLVMNCLNIDAVADPEAAGRVAAFNAALITDVWNPYDAAHPTQLLIRYDANAAVGAYNAANYVDAYHLNDTGYGLLNPGLVAAADPALAIAA